MRLSVKSAPKPLSFQRMQTHLSGLLQLMSSRTGAVKCGTLLSVALLCDRTINELCLYLCTSSNRRRWAAFVGDVLSNKIQTSAKMSTSHNKRRFHQVLIWFEMTGQDSISLLFSHMEKMRIIEPEGQRLKRHFSSVVTERHPVAVSSYCNLWFTKAWMQMPLYLCVQNLPILFVCFLLNLCERKNVLMCSPQLDLREGKL